MASHRRRGPRFAGDGSEADEGFLDSQSGRLGGQVAQAMDCAGPR